LYRINGDPPLIRSAEDLRPKHWRLLRYVCSMSEAL